MKYAIIADIHANLCALKAVVEDATEHGVESFAVIGDIVGYGPLPRETVAAVRRIADTVIAGNHDDAVSGRRSSEDFNDLAAEAVQRHRDTLDQSDIDYLASLPYTAKIDGALLAHGDFTSPADFNYIDSDDAARVNFNACAAEVMFVGHTHTPGVWFEAGSVGARDFTIRNRCIVNPGSVGYPREQNGRCVSSYVIYDSTAKTVTFRYIAFSVSSVMQRGIAVRHGVGRWLAGFFTVIAIIAAVFITKHIHAPVNPPPPAQLSSLPGPIELALNENIRVIRPRLELAKDSAPVLLTVAFPTSTNSYPVKRSSNKTIKAPKSASSVTLSLSPIIPGSEPEVISFKPYAAAK